MTRRLHEIAADYQALEDLLLEMGGEITPEVAELIAELGDDLDAKVDGYAALFDAWLADAAKWGAEEERVAAHRQALEDRAVRAESESEGVVS